MNFGAAEGRCSGYICRVTVKRRLTYFQEYVGKAGSKVRSVDVQLLLPGNVHILAPRTVHLYARGRKLFAYADRQHTLSLAKHSRAVSEAAEHVFFFHHCEAPRRQDKAGMDEPVEVHGRLVNFEEVLIVQIFRIRGLGRENHLHGFVEKLDLLPKAVEVEVVANVLLVDFDEVLVALQVAKPTNPAGSGLTVVIIVQLLYSLG